MVPGLAGRGPLLVAVPFLEEGDALVQDLQALGHRCHLPQHQALPHLIQVVKQGGQFLKLGHLALQLLELAQETPQPLDIVLLQHHHLEGQLFEERHEVLWKPASFLPR